MYEVNSLLPWLAGNLELAYSVPQVRRMEDEGSPLSHQDLPILITIPSSASGSLRTSGCVSVCVEGGCPLEQSDDEADID